MIKLNFRDEAIELRKQGLSLSQMTYHMRDRFPNLTEKQVYEKVHACFRSKKNKTGKPNNDGKRVVGVFGDAHAPFNHPRYLDFVKSTFRKFGVTDVVCLGDMVDFHALSRWQSEGCAKGAYDEFDAAYDEVTKWVKAFPRLKFCLGNHDRIPERQAATLGIGSKFVKDLRQLFHLPRSWEIGNEFIIDGVLYRHSPPAGGKDGALNSAIQERMSVCIGHQHCFGGVKYSSNKREVIFGMNCGCGIDEEQYAFAYGKNALNRPTLGCGIVFSSEHAVFVPMTKEWRDGTAA